MHLVIRSFKYKISLFVIVCLAFSLIINGLLNYFNFEESYKSARRSNFIIIAEDIVGTIEYGLDMGIKPEEMKNIQELLNIEILENKNIKYLAVTDKNGHAIYNAGDFEKSNTSNNNFCIKDSKEQIKKRTVCIPINNSFKVNVAYLLLKYTSENEDNPLKAMAIYLIKLFIFTMIISSVIITLSVSFIFFELIQNFIKMNASIIHMDESDLSHIDNDDVSQVLNKFKKTSKELIKDLDEIEKCIEREDV